MSNLRQIRHACRRTACELAQSAPGRTWTNNINNLPPFDAHFGVRGCLRRGILRARSMGVCSRALSVADEWISMLLDRQATRGLPGASGLEGRLRSSSANSHTLHWVASVSAKLWLGLKRRLPPGFGLAGTSSPRGAAVVAPLEIGWCLALAATASRSRAL